MIPLLLIFFVLGALMCALVSFEPQPGRDFAPRRRPAKKNSRRRSPKVEPRHGLEVESGHTATGSAHGQ